MSNSIPELTKDVRIDDLLERVREAAVGKTVSASEWDEVAEFIRQNIYTDEWWDAEVGKGRTLGRDEMRKQASDFVLSEAAESFRASDDQKAKLLRGLALRINAIK